jgi:hypothetical protein
VITDLLLTIVTGLANLALAPLPEGHLDLPSPSGLANVLGGVDSLVPILGPLSLAMTVLAAVGVFIAVRLVLVVVNIVWP